MAIEGNRGVDREPSDSVSQVTEYYSIELNKGCYFPLAAYLARAGEVDF